MSIIHDHRSGRYDRSVALLRKDLDESADTGANVITGTEADQRAQKGARRREVIHWATEHHFSCITGSRDSNNDCFILTAASDFNHIAGGTIPIASIDRPEPPDAAWQVVTDRHTGQRLLISVFHAPHAVEIAGRFRPGKKARQWRTEIRNWHAGVEALAKKHHTDAEIMVGDWNINLRSKHFRAWLAAEFPDWTIPANAPATHGKWRAIDFALTRGLDRGGVKALPKTRASDHRGIRNLLDWHRKKAPVSNWLDKISLGWDSSGRPLVIDRRTKAKFDKACHLLGFNLTIVQGSYRAGSGAKASAGTHDGGGVIDIRVWNLPKAISVDTVVRVLRESGFIAWSRTKAQGFDPHIHAIDYGNPRLAPSAVRQVAAWKAGRNGLASNGADDGPRINIPKDPPTEKDWFDMASKDDLRAIVREELQAQYRDEKGAPSIGNARVEDPAGGVTYTLARYLIAILTGVNDIKKMLAAKGGK